MRGTVPVLGAWEGPALKPAPTTTDLDIAGAGFGRHAFEVARRGASVVALDRSFGFVAGPAEPNPPEAAAPAAESPAEKPPAKKAAAKKVVKKTKKTTVAKVLDSAVGPAQEFIRTGRDVTLSVTTKARSPAQPPVTSLPREKRFTARPFSSRNGVSSSTKKRGHVPKPRSALSKSVVRTLP